MSDIWDAVRVVQRFQRPIEMPLTQEEKVDLLAQMVSNLIDEVEILKSLMGSPLPPDKREEQYRCHKLWLLFSSRGANPPPLEKYEPYLENAQQTAKRLIPEDAERAQQIQDLGSLT